MSSAIAYGVITVMATAQDGISELQRAVDHARGTRARLHRNRGAGLPEVRRPHTILQGLMPWG